MLELVEAQPFVLVDRKSRFIAELFPATTVEEVRDIVASQRVRYPESGHCVYAMAIGLNAEIQGCSDDGEPSGTAGRPVLEVLKGSGISQVILTVVRIWGGIKLGTGGLVHAYSGAAKGVLETAVTRERIAMSQLEFQLDYSILEKGKRILQDSGFTVLSENYTGEGACISGSIPTVDLPPLADALRDLTRGKISLL